MQSNRREEWSSATQIVWRFLNLSSRSTTAPWAVIAITFVVAAVLLAVTPEQSVFMYAGAVLWFVAAAMAIRGYVRIIRLKRSNPN